MGIQSRLARSEHGVHITMKQRFLQYIQQDMKLFLYLECLMMLFRILFIGIYASQLNHAGWSEIGYALWLGIRISLKTAAFLTAFSFIFATIAGTVWERWPAEKIRWVIGSIVSGLLALFFMIRIPYYQAFHSSFNIMIFNGMQDDVQAIWNTIVQQYQVWPRLVGTLLLIALVVYGWKRLIHTRRWQPVHHQGIYCLILIVLLPVFGIFCRFGGAFNSTNGIPWESAARTHTILLNEGILDDGQALYRAYSTYLRAHERVMRTISPEELKQAIAVLQGNLQAKTIDEAFTRVNATPLLSHKPKQVIVILGENYAVWPLLEPYKEMGLAKTGEMLAEKGMYTYQFLANGNGTMTSLNGFLTGLPDVGIYQNYLMGKHGDVDALGIASVMKKLGYKTVFWYGGLRSWQDLGDFSQREGFDEFHCADEFTTENEATAWGVADEDLFHAVEQYMDHENAPTFHFILTTTNHPPFAYPVDAKGFPRSEVEATRPASIPSDTATMNQLGHIWYADNEIGKFISMVENKEASTLFVVTGDHAERFDFATNVSLWELSGIPCFFYGAGVSKDMLRPTDTGSHLQIAPTLAALIGPAGSTYESLLPPLMHSDRAFNHRLIIEDGRMQEQKDMTDDDFKQYIEAARTVAVWRITKGNEIP